MSDHTGNYQQPKTDSKPRVVWVPFVGFSLSVAIVLAYIAFNILAIDISRFPGFEIQILGREPRLTNLLLVLTNAALVLVTIGYVFIATLQLRAMRAALTFTRKANALTLRAWLVLVSLDKDWYLGLGPPSNAYAIDVKIRNVGKLPAVQARMRACHDVFETGSPTWPITANEERDEDGDGLTIGAHRPEVPQIPLRLSPEKVLQIRNGEGTLAVSIEVTYTDAIGTSGSMMINAWWHHDGGWYWKTYKIA